MLVFLLLSSVIVLARSQSHCPEGWLNYGVSCYMVVEKSLDWEGARDHCVVNTPYHYGHLATIHDAKENDFITYVVLKGVKTRAWIGLSIDEDEGTFVWHAHNAEPFLPEQARAFWKTGEPNNRRGDENCVEINRGGLGKWNDVKCRKPLPFVCELELFTLAKGGQGTKAGLPKADPRFPN